MAEDFQIRAEDFRRAWPNALHRALVESCDLATTLDEQRVRIEALAAHVPHVIDAALLRLSQANQANQASQAQLDALIAEHIAEHLAEQMAQYLGQIQKAHALLLQEQAHFMAAFADERRALELARAKAEAARQDLEKSRQAFGQLGFFRRLFAKV